VNIGQTSVAKLEVPLTKPKLRDSFTMGSNRKRKRTT